MTGIGIAYYSRAGANYRNGRIIDLPTGNTEVLANALQAICGGELFRIEPVVPYPFDYDGTLEQARRELAGDLRPPLKDRLDRCAACHTVFVGYPIWFGVMPMPVLTFLGMHDFSGKTLIPFCTHEGSGLGMSERYFRQACPKARVLPGFAVSGSRLDRAEAIIRQWMATTGNALASQRP